jgi:hypothetical protein
MRQYLKIRFDRPINPKQHYISPGGYEVELKSGRKIQFDFYLYWGYVDKEDPTVLHIVNRILDEDAFPEALDLDSVVSQISKIIECYIYTGEEEKGDFEIHPIEILAWTIDDVPIHRDILIDYKFTN